MSDPHITDAERWQAVEALFDGALEQPAEQRAAWLEAATDDAEIRREVAALLTANDRAEGFLERRTLPEPGVSEGTMIGPYRVLRPLGQGGMGDVYLAVREQPFRRYVALKLSNQGTDAASSRARFEIERQILASLDHPGIARLFDGDVTEAGRPYFAMEYVEGKPITAYCNERGLPVEERVRLFVRVCEAVHYAHQNLVLHRDLKPSNILVTTRLGSEPSVKLLDFGIAKLLNPQMSHLTVAVTREVQRPMTPDYASPEQIRGEALTTASDIYSLGVLLYELLAGCLPYRLDGRSVHEMIQIVSGEPPMSPSSAVVAADGATASYGGAHGKWTVAQVQRRLRGDLDAICLKALRKDPGARYGSAELLAQDVERHLAQEPVLARRGNRRYQAMTFLRRNRVGVGVTTLVVIALAFGLGVAIWQGRQAAFERDRAEQVSAFIMDMLGEFEPDQAEGGQLDVDVLLDQAVERIESHLEAQPVVQARLYKHIGDLYRRTSQADAAERVYRLTLAIRQGLYGETHKDVSESLNDIAWARWAQGAHLEADSLFVRSLEIQKHLPRPDMLTQTTALNGLALVRRALGDNEGALQLAREAFVLREAALAPNDPLVVKALNDVAAINYTLRRYDEAAGLFERSVALWRGLDEPLELATALTGYGAVLLEQGDYEASTEAHDEALAVRRRVLGDDHPKVAESLSHLCWLLQTQGRYAEAEPRCREALTIRETAYGESHVLVGHSLLMLGEVRAKQGDGTEGPLLSGKGVQVLESILGADHPMTLRAGIRHALNLDRTGKTDEAVAVVRRILPDVRRVLGPENARTREAEALLQKSQG